MPKSAAYARALTHVQTKFDDVIIKWQKPTASARVVVWAAAAAATAALIVSRLALATAADRVAKVRPVLRHRCGYAH